MKRLLLLFVLLAGCAEGPQKDLPSIGEARSLAAEWAMVNEQGAKGQLTATYVQSMRQSVREELSTISQSLTEPQSARIVADLLAQPDDASPAALRTRADQLKQIEDSLESA